MAEGGYDPRHRNSDSRSRQVCRFYLRNSCTKGDRCAFRHDRNGTSENDVICKYYQLGCCTYGKDCIFTHVKAGKLRDTSRGQASDQYNGFGSPSKPSVREFPSSKPSVKEYPSSKPSVREFPSSKPSVKEYPSSKPSVKEYPSRMVTLRKNGTDRHPRESESAGTRKEFDPKWARAQDFVPGKKFHGSVPSSYASAVQPNQTSVVKDDVDSDFSTLIREGLLLCPFFEHSGQCPNESECEYAHAFICDYCGLPKLHPTIEELREKHIKECIAEHEIQMERAFAMQASQDKECGICLENVIDEDCSSTSRFGILENCNHCFCLSCIRTWRHNKSDVIQTQRTCPTCRTHSDFVTPSKFWVESPEAKKKLIEDYKKAMSSKPCQYFKRGKGECPFDNRCFYQHALEDGTIVHENVCRRRRRMNADGERTVEDDYSLWDFITRREEDGQLLPLDAQLSLVLLGIFQDSDDEDDVNNNFALRYSILNGDFVFTDSELDTDSD